MLPWLVCIAADAGNLLVLPQALDTPLLSVSQVLRAARNQVGCFIAQLLERPGVRDGKCCASTLKYSDDAFHALSRYFIAWCGALNMQGNPIWWAMNHTWHHRFSDTPWDPHTPREARDCFSIFLTVPKPYGSLEAKKHPPTASLNVAKRALSQPADLISYTTILYTYYISISYYISILYYTTMSYHTARSHDTPFRVSGLPTLDGSSRRRGS